MKGFTRTETRFSLCGDKPSAKRTRPQGCISAPLFQRDYLLFPPSVRFFKLFKLTAAPR